MPYKIIFKKKRLKVNKIMYYLGKKVVEVIDCRTKAGLERYYKLFPHKRIVREKKSNRHVISNNQIPLIHFLDPINHPKPKRRKRRPYKRNYIQSHPDRLEHYTLPIIDELAFQSQSGYTGSLYQLFLGAELDYFDDVQESLNIKPLPGYCSLKDIIKLEITRIKLDLSDRTKFLQNLENWTELQIELGIEQKIIPSYSYYHKLLSRITPGIMLNYFLLLRKKCEFLDLYDNEIDVWDGRFFESYESSSTYDKTKAKSLNERGVYVHQSKYFGIGYLESRIINYRFRLPKFYLIINPRYNDNQILKETFETMISYEIAPSKIFLADRGPKGKEVKNLVSFFHSIPLFAGPKNASGSVLVTKKNRNFYVDYIPEEYWTILDDLYDVRTNIEQSFGFDVITYGVSSLEGNGYESASHYIGLVNCLSLLNAIAAVITNQIDLITKPSAFRNLSLAKQGKTFSEVELTKIPPKHPFNSIFSFIVQ